MNHALIRACFVSILIAVAVCIGAGGFTAASCAERVESPPLPFARVSPKVVLAILPLETTTSTTNSLGVVLMNALESEFSDVDGLSLVERHRISEVLSEMRLGQTGALDPKTVVEVGKLLGANTMGFGSFLRLGGASVLTFRLVDVSSGRIICGTVQRSAPDSDPTHLVEPAAKKILGSGCLMKKR